MNIFKHIIWDWNGTLLDDVDVVVDVMNVLLKKRNMELLNNNTYKDKFIFPVKNYYNLIGFDFKEETFESLALEYVTQMKLEKYQYKLYSNVKMVLKEIKNRGINQYILSAAQEKDLIELVNKLGINQYFQKIMGLNNYYADSKVKRGKDLIQALNVDVNEVLFIGDTIHDYEVAHELGCDCLIVANGHQSFKRLKEFNVTIVQSLKEVVNYIEENK